MHRALRRLSSARFDAPLGVVAAVDRVRQRTALDFSKARARAGFGRGHLLDVVVYLPGGGGGSHERDAAEELVRLVIGEELFERWVGRVSATPTVRGGALAVLNPSSEASAALPLATLPDTVSAAVSALRRELPALPAASTNEEDWLLFELTPEPARDYPAQDDLLLCTTRLPELKKSFLRGEPFFSGRFCAGAALFTYLKYESSVASAEARLAERSRFEEAIARVMKAEQGSVVGLGLGLRYGYIDLALLDPDCLEERLLPALREANISRRAWLLFCDSELERELLPVYPDSPEPYWG